MSKLKKPEEIELNIKKLISEFNCMGAYGLVELELRNYYKSIYNQAIDDVIYNVDLGWTEENLELLKID